VFSVISSSFTEAAAVKVWSDLKDAAVKAVTAGVLHTRERTRADFERLRARNPNMPKTACVLRPACLHPFDSTCHAAVKHLCAGLSYQSSVARKHMALIL
jgi:hypothetical protein